MTSSLSTRNAWTNGSELSPTAIAFWIVWRSCSALALYAIAAVVYVKPLTWNCSAYEPEVADTDSSCSWLTSSVADPGVRTVTTAVPGTDCWVAPPRASVVFVRLGFGVAFSGWMGMSLSEPWNLIVYTSSFCETTTLSPAPANGAIADRAWRALWICAALAFQGRAPVFSLATRVALPGDWAARVPPRSV